MAGAWCPAGGGAWGEWSGPCPAGGMIHSMQKAEAGHVEDETPRTHTTAGESDQGAEDNPAYFLSKQVAGGWPMEYHPGYPAIPGTQAMMWGGIPWNAEAPSYEQLNGEQGQPFIGYYPGTDQALPANEWWGPTH